MSQPIRWFTRTVLVAVVTLFATSALSGQTTRMEGLQLSRTGPLEDPALEARASAIASQLRCVVCQGLSIQASPSPLAQDMKDLIRTQVAAGATDEEVRQYFISKYGEYVLLEPDPRGFNLVVYVLPFIGLLLGIGLVVVMVRRWTVPGGEEPAPEAP